MIKTLDTRSRFDLHMHTTRSDGKYAPEEVLRRCAAGGLGVVAITDHDLAAPIAPGVHSVDGRELYVIAGSEISARHDGREYHLLVYFPGEIPDEFRAFCEKQCRERAHRYTTAIARLGVSDLPEADLASQQGQRALTRLHIARSLVDRGHATHIRDAFARYIGHASGNVPTLSLQMADAISFARACGGVTSWAHPTLPAVKQHLGDLVSAGLQGIEGLRPFVSARDRGFFRRTARKHGLFLTGGSDWHGWTDEDLGLFSLSRSELGGFVDTLLAA